MKKSLRSIFELVLIVFVLSVFPASAEKIVMPPSEVIELAQELSYKDFPKTIDIISIIRVESNFHKWAFNPEISKKNKKRKVPPSVGLMQVQGGSFDIRKNMQEGVKRLREYYLMFGSVKAAVMSYNIGPTNFRKRKYLVSGTEYWEKFSKRKSQYQTFLKGKI